MRMRKVIFLIAIFGWINSFAQDPIFYSPENMRLYNNPAMTGLNKSFSVDVGYHHHIPRLSNDFITSVTVMNQYLDNGNGVSLMLFTDNAARTITKKEIALGYGKTLKVAEEHYLAGGIQLAYFQRKLDLSQLTTGGMIDPRGGFAYPAQAEIRTNVSNLDVNAGLFYYNPFLYAGLAIKHITEPNQSFLLDLSEPEVLPRLFFGEIGFKVNLGDHLELIPNLEYRKQLSFEAFLAGVKVNFRKFYLDGGIQDAQTFYTAIGFDGDRFRCGYDLVTYRSVNTNETFFAHEVFLGMDLVLLKKENAHFFDF